MHFATYVEKIELFQDKYLKNSSTILDLGCGPGNNAKLLKSKNDSYQITGVDLSEKMIELAKETVPDVTFQVSDIRTYKSNVVFDVVIASFCIVHLQTSDTRELIKHISSLMTDGAYLYLSFMTGKKAGYETTSFSQDELYFNYYNEEEISNYLDGNSFIVKERYQEGYLEEDGSTTKDIFIFAQKKVM